MTKLLRVTFRTVRHHVRCKRPSRIVLRDLVHVTECEQASPVPVVTGEEMEKASPEPAKLTRVRHCEYREYQHREPGVPPQIMYFFCKLCRVYTHANIPSHRPYYSYDT